MTEIILDDNTLAKDADEWKALVIRLEDETPGGKWLMLPWDSEYTLGDSGAI